MVGKLLSILVFAAAGMAQAAVVHTVTLPRGDVVELRDEPEPQCPGPDGLKATWTVGNYGANPGAVIRGCYVIRDEFVYMIFEDGDRYRVPLSAFKGKGV